MSDSEDLRRLFDLIDQRIEVKRSPAPPLELTFGIVSQVTPNLRIVSAFLDGADTPTVGIAYGAMAVDPVVGDQVAIARRRADGLLMVLTVLGRDAPSSLTNPMTAVGDLIVGGADGAPTAIAMPSGLTAPRLTVDQVTGEFSWTEDNDSGALAHPGWRIVALATPIVLFNNSASGPVSTKHSGAFGAPIPSNCKAIHVVTSIRHSSGVATDGSIAAWNYGTVSIGVAADPATTGGAALRCATAYGGTDNYAAGWVLSGGTNNQEIDYGIKRGAAGTVTTGMYADAYAVEES